MWAEQQTDPWVMNEVQIQESSIYMGTKKKKSHKNNLQVIHNRNKQ